MRKDKAKKPTSKFTLDERFKYGNFSVDDGCDLAGVSRSTIYKHDREGLITITRRGRRAHIRGPELLRYLNATTRKTRKG